MVMLVAATASMSRVPTAQSPGTDVTAWAYVIFSSGELQNGYSGVAVSYGSPYTGWMQYSLANLLSPEGELILSDGSMSVFDSYGSPDIRYTSFWWVDISGAPDSYLHNDVSYSYGKTLSAHIRCR